MRTVPMPLMPLNHRKQLAEHTQRVAKGQKALDAIRDAREAAIDNEAASDAAAIRRRNQLAPDRRNRNVV